MAHIVIYLSPHLVFSILFMADYAHSEHPYGRMAYYWGWIQRSYKKEWMRIPVSLTIELVFVSIDREKQRHDVICLYDEKVYYMLN